MMSFSPVKSADTAGHYFMEADNYYLASDEYADRFEWWGKGAAKLGLSKKINEKDFLNLLEGKLPGGVEIPVSVNGKRRPGFDITFSAPKSVSILALIFKDQALIDAHQRAVDITLREIEKDAAQARVKNGDESIFERTDNLIVAKFLHDTSRELDPQLHTHSVIINATERLDGLWRALASNTGQIDKDGAINGFFESVHHKQIYFSSIYRSELAKEIVSMGYQIEILPDTKHAMFEIKGFPPAVMELFSKRREQIESVLNQLEIKNRTSNKATDFATLSSRQKKQSVDREVLHKIWQEEQKDFNFNPEDLKKAAPVDHEAQLSAREALMEASHHFAETKLVFSHSELMTQALQFSLGRASLADINAALKNFSDENFFVSLGHGEMTTRDILKFEDGLIKAARQQKAKSSAIEIQDHVLDQGAANPEQREAIKRILGSGEGICLVNISIYDKPEAFIESLLNTAEHGGQTVRILSPSRTGMNDLNIKRKSFNMWQWVVNHFKPEVISTVKGYLNRQEAFGRGNETLIIDGTHKLSPQDLSRLLSLNSKKLIFLNTEEALGHGNTAGLLRKAGVDEISFGKKEGNISAMVTEILNDGKRAAFIAGQYAKLSPAEQQDTYVLAHSNKQADQLNAEIRGALKNTGELGLEEMTLQTLNPVYLSATERRFATSYLNDMIIRRFAKGKAENYLVLKHIAADNAVLLLDEAGEKVFWNPQKDAWQTAVFKRKAIQVSRGERLVASNDMHGIGAGDQLRVTGLMEKGIEVINETTGELLQPQYELYLKHSYASTISSASRNRRSNVIADIRGFAANGAIMHELKSRAGRSLDLVTDNETKLLVCAEREQLRMNTTDTLIARQKEIPELTKFVSEESFKNLTGDFARIAALLKTQYETLDSADVAEKALQFAVAKLSEREAAFRHDELVRTALNHALLEQKVVSHEELTAALNRYQDSGELILSQSGTYWVTREALQCEREIISILKQSHDVKESLLPPEQVKQALGNSHLTQGQKDAALLILTGKDRFVMVQGDAGTGKTSMIAKVKELLAEKPEIRILGVAPTHQAKGELEAIGISAQTLQSFLVEHHEKSADLKNTLFIIDEYSMVSNKDALQFMQIISRNNGRAVKLQDIKQFEAIPAGKPAAIELKSGEIKVAYMNEIIRQQNPETLEIARTASQGKVIEAVGHATKIDAKGFITRNTDKMTEDELAKLSASVIETKDLIKTAAREFVLRVPETRNKSVLISQTNAMREELNTAVRDELKALGELPGHGIVLPRLVSRDMTQAEMVHAHELRKVSHMRLGSQYFRIIDIDERHHSVLLEDESGIKKAVHLQKDLGKYKGNVSVFNLCHSEITASEFVVIKKSDPSQGLYANQEYRVDKIEDKIIHLTHQKSEETLKLDTGKMSNLHWDYAYARTGYSQQGATRHFTIDCRSADDEHLSNQRSFYITATRHREHYMLITDNRKELLMKLARNKDKTSALEVLNETVAPKKTTVYKEPIPVLDAKDIESRLNEQVTHIAEHLLGKPNTKSSREWRYGKKGSLKIQVSGEHKGLWHNFETGEKGNLFGLISHELGLSFKDSLQYAANLIGVNQFTERIRKPEIKESAQKENNRYVEQIASEAIPVEGTLAEKYLTEHRGVQNISSPSVRFHPKVFSHMEDKKAVYYPALITLALKDDKATGMQAIYLDESASKKQIEVQKRSFGIIGGSPAMISKGIGNEASFIAEGVETAMSIRDAVATHQVIATLGKSNFKNISPDTLNKTVILCLDNDKENTFLKGKVIKESIEKLKQAGKEVLVAIPHEKGHDFNDVLKQKGLHAVAEELKKTITGDQFIHEFDKIASLERSVRNSNYPDKKMSMQYPESVIRKAIDEHNKIHEKNIPEKTSPVKNHDKVISEKRMPTKDYEMSL